MKPSIQFKKHSSFLVDMAILLSITIGYFWRVISENKYLFFQEDIIHKYFPLRFYANSVLKNFEIPFRDVYTFAGASPFLARFETGVFYPFNLLISFIPGTTTDVNFAFRVFEFQLIFHYFLASIFTYILVRYGLLLGRYASLVSGIVYSFGGFMTSYLTYNVTIIHSLPWLPLGLLFLIIAHQKQDCYYAVVTGVILGMPLLSGNLYVSLAFTTFLILYLVYVFYKRTVPTIPLLKIGFILLIFSIGISSIQLLSSSMLDNEYTIIDVSKPREVQMDWRSVVSFAIPGFFESNTIPNNFYVGILPLLFIFYAVVMQKNLRANFFIVLFFVSLVTIYGKNSIIFSWLHFLTASSNTSHLISCAGAIISLCMAILSGYGIDIFTKTLTHNDKILHKSFAKYLLIGTGVLICTIVPLSYSAFLRFLDSSQFSSIQSLINSIVFSLIFLSVGTILFQLRLWNNGKRLFPFLFIMVIFDVFSINHVFPDAKNFVPSVYYQTNTNKEDFIPQTRMYYPYDIKRFSHWNIVDDPTSERTLALYADQNTRPGLGFGGPFDIFSEGIYEVNFNMKIDDNTISDIVIDLEITDGGASKVFSSKSFKGTDFKKYNEYQKLPLILNLYNGSSLEFRAHYKGNCKLWLEKISIEKIQTAKNPLNDLGKTSCRTSGFSSANMENHILRYFSIDGRSQDMPIYNRYIELTKQITSPASLLNDLLNVRYILSDSDISKLDPKRFIPRGGSLYENLDALPRVFIPKDYKVISKREDAIVALSNLNPREFVILEEDLKISRNYYLNKDSEAKVTHYSNNRIDLDVNMATDGILVLSEVALPGWKVYIDNIKHKVSTANYTFISTVIKEGRHKVTFKYFPNIFIAGSIISIVFFAMFLYFTALQFLHWIRR